MFYRSNIFFYFSAIFVALISVFGLTYFLTHLLFDALVEAFGLSLYVTTVGGLSVLQQLIFLLN